MGWPGLLSSWYSAETWKVMCISRGRVCKQKKQSFIDDGRSMVSVLSGMDSFKPPSANGHWGFPPFTMMKTLKWTPLNIYLCVLSIHSLNKCYWVPLCAIAVLGTGDPILRRVDTVFSNTELIIYGLMVFYIYLQCLIIFKGPSELPGKPQA